MDVNIFLFVSNIVIIILSVGLLMIMPQLTRKTLLFGVRIPPEFMDCDEAKEMKSNYVRTCVFGVILMLIICVAQYVIRPDLTILATLYLILLIIPVYFIAFIPNWKRAVALKAERGWVIPGIQYADTKTAHTRGNLSSLPWAWYVISAIILLVTFVIAVIRYPELPNMIAAHMDESFQPTRMVEKTWLNVLTLPLINLATLALMVAVGISIEKAKLQIDQNNPRKSFAQHRVYRRRMGHSLGLITLSLIFIMCLVWIPIVYPELPIFNESLFWITMVIIFIPMVFIIVVMVKTGQGGTKVKVTNCEEDAAENDGKTELIMAYGRGDDKYWKLGTFYYNPDDPALIVEDRFGTNIGFNYARLPAKILIAVTVIGVIALYIWITMMIPDMIHQGFTIS